MSQSFELIFKLLTILDFADFLKQRMDFIIVSYNNVLKPNSKICLIDSVLIDVI